MLARYWSNNRGGYCRAPSCVSTPGTLEHLLATCPALSQARERLYQMWLEHTVMFPSLHATIRKVLESPADIVVQFVLEPLAFKDILSDFKSLGTQYAHQLSYLTRTFAFNMHREYQRLIKSTKDPTQYQVMNQPHTNPLSLSVPRCEGASLTVTCDQDNTAQPGGSRAVPGQATTTPASSGQALQELCQQGVQFLLVDYTPHSDTTGNVVPSLSGSSCVLPPRPSSVTTKNNAIASQCASITSPNFPAVQFTSPLYTNSDTTLQSLLPSMASQHQDYTGGFCGGWGNYDHVIQVSP